jgi:hypothetical protein
VSNESINILLNETIPSILDRLNDFDGEGGGDIDPGPPQEPAAEVIVASCKYNGTDMPYSHNVISVEIPAPIEGASGFGSCRVTFQRPVPEFDQHFAVLIQPYATNNRHVIATVTNQQPEYVEWTWLEWDGATWKEPAGKIGFSFMAVDIEQS